MVQNNDSPPFHLNQQQPPNTIYGDLDHVVLSSPQSMAYVMNYFRPRIREEVERKVKAHFNQISCPSCSNSITNMKDDDEDQDHGAVVVVGGGRSGTENDLKLCFVNKIPSTIFTMNEIEAENGEEVQVALFDVANNTIVDTAHPLSSAWIEVVALDGEFDDEEAITHSNFNKSVASQRMGERPLLVGDGKRFRLKNGVSSITNLSFTRNSSRTRTKNIRLGLRVMHDSTNNNYPTIQNAVSNPFRVKDHRGQLNKKHHPPRGEDEVWRLEGIGRNGEYHKRLSSKDILTVESFVKAHQKDYRWLRKLLGSRLSDKNWKIMVNHAFEYVPIIIPTFDPPNFEQNLVQNEAMEGETVINEDLEEVVGNYQNIGPSNGDGSFPDKKLLGEFHDFCNRIFEDNYATQTLLSQGEASTLNGQKNHVENTSTCNQNFQGAWNKLVPKPK